MNPAASTLASFDVEAIRAQFPVLHQEVHGKPLVYLDNAASTQKPQRVIDSISRYYELDNSNVHRGVHELSGRATDLFEASRETVRSFINASSTQEVIYTRGGTESINLVAQSWGRTYLKSGDEIVISAIEHHANIVPWQLLCQQTGAVLKVAAMNTDGDVPLAEFEQLIGKRTKLVAVTMVSNALGTILPVQQIIELGHAVGAVVLIDAAQAVAHLPIDVQALNCDFLAFSGHKLYSPTGTGVLFGKKALLEAMPPWQAGGDMIKTVSFSGSTWNELPYKFEAGTPHIAGAIGLGEGVRFLQDVGIEAAAAHEDELLTAATERLQKIDDLKVIGTAKHKASVLSFIVDGAHPSDIGTLLNQLGIAVRVGHHCAMPVMTEFGIPGTARASFAVYNNMNDVDRLVEATERVVAMLQ